MCPTPRACRDAAAALPEQNAAYGVVIHPRTGLPLWRGERLDIGYAIEVLHPAVRGGS